MWLCRLEREIYIYIHIRIHLVGYISFVSLVAGLRTPLDLSNRNIPLALCIARVWLRFDYQPECKISKIAVENCQFLDHSQNVDFPCALWQTNVAIESGNLKLILPINTVDFPYISYSHSAYEPPRRPGDVALAVAVVAEALAAPKPPGLPLWPMRLPPG